MTNKLHDSILELLTWKPIIKSLTVDDFFSFNGEKLDFSNKKIIILTAEDEEHNFLSYCDIEVEYLVDNNYIDGEVIDAYGSIYKDNILLLNNYDAEFNQNQTDPVNGFCNIIGFATIDSKGNVRFSQIVYSFKTKELKLNDDVSIKLPFKPDLSKDFGGKRATYKGGHILSLRTTMEVYEKTSKIYHQPDSEKNTLSYPRLILNTLSAERKKKLTKIKGNLKSEIKPLTY